MTPEIQQFLTDMATEILTIGGAVCMPLIVAICFRAGRLNSLNSQNMAERLGDTCYDTIKNEIKLKVSELLQQYGNLNPDFIVPSTRRLNELSVLIHHDSELLEPLLQTWNNLTELGLQSPEFLQILIYLAQ